MAVNGRDQDVKCLDCEKLMVPDGNGYLICTRGGCPSLDRIGPKVVAALRNQLPPNHTAVPTVELEALRSVVSDWERCRKDSDDLIDGVRAILAHLPAKKPDHVAEIRLMIDFRREQLASNDYARTARERILHEIAALEAAIELFTKEGKS